MSTLDDLRDDMITASEERKGKGDENELEGLRFKPGFKTYLVRILPPQRMKEMKL